VGGLIAWSLTASTAYYKTPSELLSGSVPAGETVRVAGKVVDGSITRQGAETAFSVTDGKGSVKVSTADLMPDTFGTGVEVVAEGAMRGETFSASTVLTKCPSKFKARVSTA